MNTYIQIALILWTTVLSFIAFIDTAHALSEGRNPFGPALLSFLSLSTALLAVGQYIN